MGRVGVNKSEAASLVSHVPCSSTKAASQLLPQIFNTLATVQPYTTGMCETRQVPNKKRVVLDVAVN